MFFSRGHSGSTAMGYSYHHKKHASEDPEIVNGDMIRVWEQSSWKFGAKPPTAEYFAYTLQSISCAISHMNVVNIRNSQSVYYTYGVQMQFPNSAKVSGRAL